VCKFLLVFHCNCVSRTISIVKEVDNGVILNLG